MCHIILMMPIFGLSVFWFMPVSQALPVYAAITLVSSLLYIPIMRAAHRPVVTGREGLRLQKAVVRRIDRNLAWVAVRGELWQAESDEPLRAGDLVEIIGQQGMTLQVKKSIPGQRHHSGESCFWHNTFPMRPERRGRATKGGVS